MAVRGVISQFATLDYRATSVEAQHGWRATAWYTSYCLPSVFNTVVFLFLSETTLFTLYSEKGQRSLRGSKINTCKASTRPELHLRFWMCWLPLNRCLPHTQPLKHPDVMRLFSLISLIGTLMMQMTGPHCTLFTSTAWWSRGSN